MNVLWNAEEQLVLIGPKRSVGLRMTGVSVVVRTFNSEKTIKDCVRSLLDQDYPDHEILIVDDGSTDSTLEIVQTFPVKMLHGVPAENPCNRGIEEARSAVVAFIDDDCTAESTWLTVIVRHFQDRKLAGVGGQELTPSGSKYWPRCFEALRKVERKLLFYWGSIEQISTCNVAYRKEALLEVGGFNNYLFSGEETELNWRLSKNGWRVIFDQELTVTHKRKSSLPRYFRQQFRTEFGMAQVLRMHSDFIKPSHLAIPSLLAILVTIPILMLSGDGMLASYLAGALVVFSVIVSSYAALLARESKLMPGILIASVAFISARCLGFLTGLATPVMRRRLG